MERIPIAAGFILALVSAACTAYVLFQYSAPSGVYIASVAGLAGLLMEVIKFTLKPYRWWHWPIFLVAMLASIWTSYSFLTMNTKQSFLNHQLVVDLEAELASLDRDIALQQAAVSVLNKAEKITVGSAPAERQKLDDLRAERAAKRAEKYRAAADSAPDYLVQYGFWIFLGLSILMDLMALIAIHLKPEQSAGQRMGLDRDSEEPLTGQPETALSEALSVPLSAPVQEQSAPVQQELMPDSQTALQTPPVQSGPVGQSAGQSALSEWDKVKLDVMMGSLPASTNAVKKQLKCGYSKAKRLLDELVKEGQLATQSDGSYAFSETTRSH